MRFLLPEQAVALAEAIDPWYRTFVYTALETGMRWSELVGLRRSGVNLLHRSIAVTEQLVFIAGDKTTGRERRWVRQRPKTRAGVRSITISRFLAERLQEQLAERSQPGQDGLVFTNQRGNAIGGSIFNKRHWQAARATVGSDALVGPRMLQSLSTFSARRAAPGSPARYLRPTEASRSFARSRYPRTVTTLCGSTSGVAPQ